jgi:hypothetical protein
MTGKRFSRSIVESLDKAKIIGVRAGAEPHRFTGVWVVVVNGRVFIRSWNDKATGWREAFRQNSHGCLQIPSGRELRITAKTVGGERLLDAIEEAYATKYNTPASRKWVMGFRRPKRRATTTELIPA